MHRRKKTSSGQALVMVTLSLFSMVGMMGLAVDLGWSYFTQKAAQAAADAAAIGAAQEAEVRLGSGGGILSSFSCASGRAGAGAGKVDCRSAPVTCANFAANDPSNLNNGCLYAKSNGFDYTNASTRQIVTIESGDGPTGTSNANRPPGVNRVAYWVRVRTIQTIPQLFSAIAGNSLGTVAANATAGVVGEIVNASYVGQNQTGDYTTDSSGNKSNYGVDINLTGAGNSDVSFCPGASGLYNICAPGGILLASTCHGAVGGSCSGYAGASKSGVFTPYTSIQGAGTIDPASTNWTGATNGAPAAQFKDPTVGLSQPPLAATSAPPSCGIPNNGDLSKLVSTGGSLTLGPYQYYAYSVLLNGKPSPTGAPITFNPTQAPNSNTTINFANNGTCPGILSATGTAQSSQAFPMYTFYGGLNIGPNTSQLSNTYGTTGSANVNFGAGQYVMAGVSSSSGYVFSALESNLTAASSAGSMFVFTNGTYSSGVAGAANLNTYMSTTVPNAGTLASALTSYGQTLVGGGSITLDGLSTSNLSGQGSALSDYGGILFWQDRRNSIDTINPANGNFVSQSTPSGVTNTSPQMNFATGGGYDGVITNQQGQQTFAGGNGNGAAGMALNGVIYQPRGAWTALSSMISEQDDSTDALASSSLQLQLISGAIIQGGEIGCPPDEGCVQQAVDFSTTLKLLAPTNPLVRYRVAMIQ